MNKPELLAPAGDFEKLQMAIEYGADAVYVGGKLFGLRANAKNFETNELQQAIEYAHNHNVKVYVTVNIFAHNEDFNGLEEYLRTLKEIGADAIIVSDLGVFEIASKLKTETKGLEIHISTQANVTNKHSALAYKKLGASRVILARELSFEEITEISNYTSDSTFSTEVFAHGAMCVAYSGRCLLSRYITNRDANQGDCTQPCRWKYHITEEKRPNEHHPIYEDERGTYIMNSKDLCMIEHIPELIETGVSSLKIEGRMKSAYYVAVTTRVYREAIDDYFSSKNLYESKKSYYLEELKKSSHREFFTGFYLGNSEPERSTTDIAYVSTYDFVGVVRDYDGTFALVEQRNKFSVGDEIEFMRAGFKQVITEIFDDKFNPLNSAPHAQQMLYIKVQQPVKKMEVLRKKMQ